MNPTKQSKGLLQGKKILITGGSGFLGRHIVKFCEAFGATTIVPRKKDFDFTVAEQAFECLKQHKPEIVIHSAAYYGGLGITMAEPATIYYKNILMGTHVMEAARLTGVQKFVSVGTACSYPGHLSHRMSEKDLWAGPLHETVAAYGSVKKMLAIQGQAYRKQFGLNAIHLIPSNLFGPYDCYDDYRSHVVGALIRKFCEAHLKKTDVTVWGTGSAIREFLYVEDCAEGIALATARYDKPEPLNIGVGLGTSIKQLVETLVEVLDFKGTVHWDTSKPDGQKVKMLDTTRMEAELEWFPRVSLKQGIAKSVEWFLENHMHQIHPTTNLEVSKDKHYDV